jgi:hypothetical protein
MLDYRMFARPERITFIAEYPAFFAGLRELPIVDILSPTTPAPWRGGEGNFWGAGNEAFPDPYK